MISSPPFFALRQTICPVLRCCQKHLRILICSLSLGTAISGIPVYAEEDIATVQSLNPSIQQASIQIKNGKFDSAIYTLNTTLLETQLTNDLPGQVYTLGTLSDAHLLSGNTHKAMELAQQSVQLLNRTSTPDTKVFALNSLGNSLVALQQFEEAKNTYYLAEQQAQMTKNHSQEISVATNLLHALINLKDIDAASNLAQSIFSKINILAPEKRIDHLVTLGFLIQQLLQLLPDNHEQHSVLKELSYYSLTEAATLAYQHANKTAESMAQGYLAELYFDNQRYTEAQQLFQRALFLSTETNTRYLSARWYSRLARLLAINNQKDKAIATYFNALSMIKTIQPMLLQGWRGYPNSFNESVGSVYRELTRLLLEKSARSTDAVVQQTTLKTIRTLMEELKSVELKEYFKDSCVTEQLTKNHNINIDDLILPGTAVLYPIVFPEHTVLLLSLTNGEIHSVTVPVSENEITTLANAFRAQMNPASNLRKTLGLAMTLYDILIKPLQVRLENQHINNLVIIPEGILRTIPFAALHDGENYLISQYAVAISPGLLLTDTSQSHNSSRKLFSAGLSEGVQGFSKLPYVKQEIETISELYDSNNILDQNFTTSRTLKELENSNYDWVTFSTHGHINKDFSQSFLLTYDNKLSLNHLETLFNGNQQSKQPVELLVLSACATAIGDERAALGLAGLALKAGVKSTMASLWMVNDRYTSILVPEFFRHLQNTQITKAQALQYAQLQLINKHNATHPYYWAAFVVAGNWQ